MKIRVRISLVFAATILLSTTYLVHAKTERLGNPQVNGKNVDKCVQGAGWGFLDPARCDLKRQREVADTYCRKEGYEKAVTWKIIRRSGQHSILTYPRNNPRSKSWTKVQGGDRFGYIDCDDGARIETRIFRHPTVNGLRIDRCLQQSNGKSRCQKTGERDIAKFFCKDRGYARSTSHRIETHFGNHSIMRYTREWRQVMGADAFDFITCERDL